MSYQDALHPTSNVAFTYDRNYNRVATMSDGIGTTTYHYVPVDSTDGVLGDGQLASVDSPLVGASIAYNHDELRRVIGRSIDRAGNPQTMDYDGLGRVSGVTNLLCAFMPSYVGSTERLDHVDWPVEEDATPMPPQS